jgi:hypothetical protein
MLEKVGFKEKSECEREGSLIGFMPVCRFFTYSDLSQTTVVSAQDKSQRASHEIFSKLVSTLSALIHLDCVRARFRLMLSVHAASLKLKYGLIGGSPW